MHVDRLLQTICETTIVKSTIMADERVAAQLRELVDYRRRKLINIDRLLGDAYANPTIDACAAVVDAARQLHSEYVEATADMSRYEIDLRFALRDIIMSCDRSIVYFINSDDICEARSQIHHLQCIVCRLMPSASDHGLRT